MHRPSPGCALPGEILMSAFRPCLCSGSRQARVSDTSSTYVRGEENLRVTFYIYDIVLWFFLCWATCNCSQ